MLRKTLTILCLCLLLCLAACGAEVQNTAPEGAPSAAPASETPAPTAEPVPTVTLGGESYPVDLDALELKQYDADTLSALCAAAPDFAALERIALTGGALEPEQLLALREAYPEAQLQYTLSLLGEEIPGDAEHIDWSGRTTDEISAAPLAQLPALLPELKEIDLIGTDAEKLLDLDALSALREALPEQIALRCRFELYGQIVDSDMEEIIYEKAGLKSPDLDRARLALPLLTSCRRFVMDNCGPSYEALAALRDEFPDKGVVWRIHLNQDSLLTDATVLWTIYVTDDNCDALKYCTELEYIDLGHAEWFSDIGFTAYMPKLKVLIIALTGVKDISPLANCPELEYLEVFGSEVSDLSPLANCTKLEHLNIGTLLHLTDITPLYELTSLKRLWMINSGGVPREQCEEIARRLPDCEMVFSGEDPTWYGWRYRSYGVMDERYALLKEQIGYNGYNSPADKIDWDKTWKPEYAEMGG